ncbi:uncharacterized protein LOC129242815 [Anastrepha obliqua]|uniref:uncharacterized protein LOC129242815 n=1 Tax=Anastrepha obliqua TaxID=95512 RepID=UPI0024093020|nr:uncharacterized protein LOC129242815 [Anastrepha obliqua]
MLQRRKKPQRTKLYGRRKITRNKRSRERRRIERQQDKLREMSLQFGKTIAPNFGRAFLNSERQLTRHPYLNFLRYFKSIHPTFGFTRILREGAKSWKRMKSKERKSFTQKEVLKTLLASKDLSNFNLFPVNPIPFDYHPHSLSLKRNVERKLRNRQLIPRGKAPANPITWRNYF